MSTIDDKLMHAKIEVQLHWKRNWINLRGARIPQSLVSTTILKSFGGNVRVHTFAELGMRVCIGKKWCISGCSKS